MTGAAQSDGPVPALLAGYRPLPGTADEMMTASGSLRPVWTGFIDYLARQDDEKLLRRFARGDQHLRDAGV
jgi:uncharacterized circularly permuted ATP-grasp superfamily protein